MVGPRGNKGVRLGFMSATEADSAQVSRSGIVWGSVSHCRMSPRKHAFSYPMVTLELDLDELEMGSLNSWIFRFNRSGILSVKRGDYLKLTGFLRAEVEQILAEHGVNVKPYRITLVTMPRLFGYIFNPVSFFLCFDPSERLIGCITQVRNTFGEAHLYPLVCEPQALPVEWRFSKDFFVSPFFDADGEYRVAVREEGARLSIMVDLYKYGEQAFGSELKGESKPFSGANLVKTLIRYPLTLLLTMPRIHIQALILFVYTKLKPFIRPEPTSPYTIYSRQNSIHRARLWLLAKLRTWRDN